MVKYDSVREAITSIAQWLINVYLFIVTPVVVLLLCAYILVTTISEHTVIGYNDPIATSDPGLFATLQIEKLNVTTGTVNGTAKVDYYPLTSSNPITATQIITGELLIMARSQRGTNPGDTIAAESGAMALRSISPSLALYAGTTPLQWEFAPTSTAGTMFPFDHYQLELTRVDFDTDRGVATIPTDTVRVLAPNLMVTLENPAQGSNTDSPQPIVTLERPLITRGLFTVYILFAIAYIVALWRIAKPETLVGSLIGLTAIFGARETLSRGADVFPTLLDFVLFLAFLLIGMVTIYRVLLIKPPKQAPPAH